MPDFSRERRSFLRFHSRCSQAATPSGFWRLRACGRAAADPAWVFVANRQHIHYPVSIMARTSTDDTAPATRADVQRLETRLDRYEKQFASIDDQFKALLESITRTAEETRQHFDVIAENLTKDYRDIFKDRTEQHRDTLQNLNWRLRRVERELGIVA
ncbi:MAG: hypothetical protein KY475_21040 [Planctomycetes bacterium]|nr:hypothetical protein [Planctomycetota bacterium]